MMKVRLIIAGISLFIITSYTAYTMPDLERAESAYSQADFALAKSLYHLALENMARDGKVSGHLLYNLGNCYYRLKDYGKSLLYYQRAKSLLPNDRDLNANIEIVSQALKLANTDERIFSERLLFWNHFFSLPTLWLIFLWMHGILLLLIAIRFFIPTHNGYKHRLTQLLCIQLAIYGVVFFSCLSKAMDLRTPLALVTVEESSLRSGKGKEFIAVLTLPQGTLVNILEQGADWWKIAVRTDSTQNSEILKGYVLASTINEIGAWKFATGRNLISILTTDIK